MHRRISRRSIRRAFSLLEVLLVVVILGILAAFVVPNLIGTGDKAKIDTTRSMVLKGGTLGLALDLYRTNVGEYPETLKELYEPPTDEEKKKRWGSTPYIDNPSAMKDAWGRDLQYKRPGQHNEQSYDLWSLGPDGQDATDDDIGNWDVAK